MIKKFGAIKLFLCSIAVVSLFTTAFSVVDQVSAPSTFLALSIIFVMAISMAYAGSFSSNYVVATHEVQAMQEVVEGKGALGPATIETMFAVGGVIGPLLGGLLYPRVGWSGLLLVLGLTNLLLTILALIAFTPASVPVNLEKRQKTPITYCSALRLPPVLAAYL